MIRKFKTMGVALVAVFAMSALAATAAQAGTFEAASYPSTITGTQTVKHEFTTTAGVVKCNTASFTGTLTAASAELTMTPTYGTCTIAGIAATVDFKTDECDYLFTAGETTAAESVKVETHLKCKTGGKVRVKVTSSECEITIFPQTVGGITAATSGTGVLATIAATGIAYDVDKGEKCPNAATNMTGAVGSGAGEADGKYHGTATLTGSTGQIRVT